MSNKKAIKFVTNLFKHVVSQDSSGSNAAKTFFSGKGDVLITYESEAYAAFAAGQQGKLVVPKPTMLIQLPMVATKDAPGGGQGVHQVHARAEAAEDLRRQRLPAGREVGAEELRPRKAGARSTTPARPSTSGTSSSAAGGRRTSVWFDLDNGRMVAIERAVGGPTH